MSRLRKSIISICVAVCMCFLSVCSFSINTHAAGEVYLPYNEPSTSDSQGYIVLGIDMDGTREYVTFHWALSGSIEKLPFDINITQNSITFSCALDNFDSIYVDGYIAYYNYEGVYRVLKSYNLAVDDEITFRHNFSSGITVKSYFVRGAVGSLSTPYTTVIPGKVVFLGGVSGSELLSVLNQVVAGTVDINTYLRANIPTINNYLKSSDGYLKSIDSDVSIMTPLLQDYLPYIQYIFTFLDNNIENVLNTISYRLGTIIEDLGVQSAEDKQASDDFAESSSSQSNALNQATQDSQTEKVDADAAAGQVDDVLSTVDINEGASQIFIIFTNNSLVVTLLLLVFTVALISYVLFGKR